MGASSHRRALNVAVEAGIFLSSRRGGVRRRRWRLGHVSGIESNRNVRMGHLRGISSGEAGSIIENQSANRPSAHRSWDGCRLLLAKPPQ